MRCCVCFSLRRVSGGLAGRVCRVCCRSCFRVTGGDAACRDSSCCFRVTGAGGWTEEADEEDEEEEEEDDDVDDDNADEVVGAAVEQSCLRVTGGEGEEDEEDEDTWRPFTSSLTPPLGLLFGDVLLRTASASLFTARLSSLGMIFPRYAEVFLWTTVTWRRTSRLRRDS